MRGPPRAESNGAPRARPTCCPIHGGTFPKMPGRARRSDPDRRIPIHADERVDPAIRAAFKDDRATGAQGDRVPTYPIRFVAKTRGESKVPRSISKWASMTFPLEGKEAHRGVRSRSMRGPPRAESNGAPRARPTYCPIHGGTFPKMPGRARRSAIHGGAIPKRPGGRRRCRAKPGGPGLLGLFGDFDAVVVDLLVERGPRDPEDLRGLPFLALHEIQGAEDRDLLDVIE